MPTPSTSRWPQPKGDDEFEDMVLDALRVRWQDPYAYRYGRRGQRQHGIDILGSLNKTGAEQMAAQCKITDSPGLEMLQDELLKTAGFPGHLGRYVLVLSASRDGRLQDAVKALSAEREKAGLFPLDVLFYDDICQDLATDSRLVAKHFPGWLPSADQAKGPVAARSFRGEDEFSQYVSECVVRLVDSSRNTKGTAFWVSGSYCVTCFHVLTEAQGPVSVEHRKRVLAAQYRPELSSEEDDVAVLEVLSQVSDVSHVPLGSPIADVQVGFHGFRAGSSKGYLITGTLRMDESIKIGGPSYSIETDQPEYDVVAETSGAPVFDPTRMVVVGMQSCEEKDGLKRAWVIPAQRLFSKWTALSTLNHPVATAFKRKRLARALRSSGLERQISIVEPVPRNSSADEKRRFHRIVSLGWDHIAAHDDSPRALYEEIWPLISDKGNAGSLICISGVPLSGKSTLMRRLGYDAASAGVGVIHALEHAHTAELWSRIPELTGEFGEPLCLLVDDIFEDSASFAALRKLAGRIAIENLPITVIATTLISRRAFQCIADLRKDGTTVLQKELVLTASDKENICRNLGIDRVAVEARTYERLMEIDSFYGLLAQLRELAEGAAFEPSAALPAEVLEEQRLSRLRLRQPRVYEAYMYVCFAHRFGVTLPLSVLANIAGGRYSDILLIRGRQDWIFEAESSERPDAHMLKTAHWALAGIHWDTYLQSHSPSEILRVIAAAAEPGSTDDELAILHLIRGCLGDPHINAKAVLTRMEQRLGSLRTSWGVDHWMIWSRLLKQVGMTEKADDAVMAAKRQRPVNVADLRVLIDLIQDEDPQQALAMLEEWRKVEPRNRVLNVRYLLFIEQKAPSRLEGILSDTDSWITDDPGNNWDVIATYVDLVIRHLPALAPQVGRRLKAWLDLETDSEGTAPIWIHYLKVVEANQTGEDDGDEMRAALGGCWQWLARNQESRGFTLLAHAYGTLINKYGSADEKRTALKEFIRWLEIHPEAGHVWVACLNLVDGDWADRDDLIMMVDKVVSGLNSIEHPNTIVKLLTLFEKYGNARERREIIDALQSWFDDPRRWDENFARRRFIAFSTQYGDREQVQRAFLRAKTWIDEHESDQGLRVSLLSMVERRLPDRLPAFVAELNLWARAHPDASAVIDKLLSIERRQMNETGNG